MTNQEAESNSKCPGKRISSKILTLPRYYLFPKFQEPSKVAPVARTNHLKPEPVADSTIPMVDVIIILNVAEFTLSS